MKRVVVGLAALMLGANVFADVVYMENGDRIEGKIISRTDDAVVIETNQGTEEISRKYVQRIITGSPAKPAEEVPAPQQTQTKDEYKYFDDGQPQEVRAERTEQTRSVSPLSKEKTLKFGLDLNGNHGASMGGANSSESTTTGITMTGETVGYFGQNFGCGCGVSYQVPRKMNDYDGNFSFLPVYGILKLRSVPSRSGQYFYGVGQVGYNFFFGDDDYKGSGTLSGGLYYGFGLGACFNRIFVDLLYSVNHGTYKNSGYYYPYYYDYTMDIDYSKIALSMGFAF